MARDTCLYCGAPLPAEAVAAARQASAELAESSPTVPAGQPTLTETRQDRVLLVLDLDHADPATLAEALGVSTYEARQRAQRAGRQLHRATLVSEAEAEAARLEAGGLRVVRVPESEARAALQPILATGGRLARGALHVRAGEARLELTPSDILLVVRGPITREYQTATSRLKLLRTSSLEPGYRFQLHRRSDRRPVELDPGSFELSGPRNHPGSSLLELAAWIRIAASGMPVDERFRLLPPAMAPAAPGSGIVAVAEALGAGARSRQEADQGAVVLDNLAQFRFYSGWLGASERHAPSIR